MARWLAIATDTNSLTGGTNLDAAGAYPPTIADPTIDIPVRDGTGNVDANTDPRDREDEVRGVRGVAAPRPFSADPVASFGCRTYPEMLRAVLPAWFSTNPANSGTVPAAVTSKFAGTDAQVPRAFRGKMVREGQQDDFIGAAVDTVSLSFPVDQEGDMAVALKPLYTRPLAPASSHVPSFAALDDVYLLRDLVVTKGATPVTLPCVAGLEMTFNNGLLSNFGSRYCAGQCVESRTSAIDSLVRKVWWPSRNKLGKRKITGKINFGDPQPGWELERMFAECDKMTATFTGGAAGTTPPSAEVMRITIYQRGLTGGGANPLQSFEQDQTSEYEFGCYLDGSNKDVEVEFVGAAAVPNP